MTNSDLLREKIRLSGYKLAHVAKTAGMTPQSLQKKIENVSEFKASEVYLISKLLKLDAPAQQDIFFAPEVEFNSTGGEGASS